MTFTSGQLLLAAPQAASGYTSPGSFYNSLGRWASTTQLNSGVPLNNLFPDETGPMNAASQVDYQCLFVYNSDTTQTMTNMTAWIPSSSVIGALQWAVGVDSTNASPYNHTLVPQAGYISSPTIAPATVSTWAGPSSDVSGGRPMNPLAPGMVSALWIRRTAVGSPAFSGAGCDLQVTFDVIS